MGRATLALLSALLSASQCLPPLSARTSVEDETLQTRRLPSRRDRSEGTIVGGLPAAVCSASTRSRLKAANPTVSNTESAIVTATGISGRLVATDGSVPLYGRVSAIRRQI